METLLERKRKLVERVDPDVTLLYFFELRDNQWSLWYLRDIGGTKGSHGCVDEEEYES